MGRFVYWMNVSVDLRIERVEGEAGGGEWVRIGEELHREFNARARRLSLAVQGRVMHELMEGYWPNAAQDESGSEIEREYGQIWLSTPKVLVSNTRTSADYNTRIVGGPDAIDQLAKIRSETEGDIGVGGATLATQLLRAGLIDELMLFIHPVVLGTGRPLFDDQTAPLELDLIENTTYPEGVVLHRYSVRGAREA